MNAAQALQIASRAQSEEAERRVAEVEALAAQQRVYAQRLIDKDLPELIERTVKAGHTYFRLDDIQFEYSVIWREIVFPWLRSEGYGDFEIDWLYWPQGGKFYYLGFSIKKK